MESRSGPASFFLSGARYPGRSESTICLNGGWSATLKGTLQPKKNSATVRSSFSRVRASVFTTQDVSFGCSFDVEATARPPDPEVYALSSITMSSSSLVASRGTSSGWLIFGTLSCSMQHVPRCKAIRSARLLTSLEHLMHRIFSAPIIFDSVKRDH